MNSIALANKVWKEIKTFTVAIDDDHIQKIVDKIGKDAPDFVRQNAKLRVSRQQRKLHEAVQRAIQAKETNDKTLFDQWQEEAKKYSGKIT